MEQIGKVEYKTVLIENISACMDMHFFLTIED